MTDTENTDHWLVRPSTIRLLWWTFSGVLGLTLLAQVFIPIKGYFVVDGWFGFAAIFGFVACAVMVFVAKGLGLMLKRRQSYYDGGDADV